MLNTIYLIRHGTRINRSEETLLSPLGVKQAKQTAKYLLNKNIKNIYTSPLPRTQQTANIIAQSLNLSIKLEDRLKERMVYDPKHGETFEEFLLEWDKTMGDRNYVPLYGNSAFETGRKLTEFLEEIIEDSVLISHGGAIGDLLRNMFSDAPLTFLNDKEKDLKWVQISECSITEIVKEGNNFTLKRVNDAEHLNNN